MPRKKTGGVLPIALYIQGKPTLRDRGARERSVKKLLLLDIVVVIKEVDVPYSPSVVADKLSVALRTLISGIRRQHALYTHADTLHRLHRRPARGTEQVEANDAVAVDMGVHWNRSRSVRRGGKFDELNLRRLWKLKMMSCQKSRN
jgi:hypothetical protein